MRRPNPVSTLRCSALRFNGAAGHPRVVSTGWRRTADLGAPARNTCVDRRAVSARNRFVRPKVPGKSAGGSTSLGGRGVPSERRCTVAADLASTLTVINDIEGWLRPEQAEALWRAASRVPTNGCVVEIGKLTAAAQRLCWRGPCRTPHGLSRSTLTLVATAAPRGRDDPTVATSTIVSSGQTSVGRAWVPG